MNDDEFEKWLTLELVPTKLHVTRVLDTIKALYEKGEITDKQLSYGCGYLSGYTVGLVASKTEDWDRDSRT